MKKYIIILLLSISFAGSVSAKPSDQENTATISGRVFADSISLIGARVYLYTDHRCKCEELCDCIKPEYRFYTQKDGTWSGTVRQNNYLLRINYVGMKNHLGQINITGDTNLEDIELKRDPDVCSTTLPRECICYDKPHDDK